jgi:hypothetical protein
MVLQANIFAAAYAERSGVTVEFLREWGRFPEPCHCHDDLCDGWAMGHQWEDAIVAEAMR